MLHVKGLNLFKEVSNVLPITSVAGELVPFIILGNKTSNIIAGESRTSEKWEFHLCGVES